MGAEYKIARDSGSRPRDITWTSFLFFVVIFRKHQQGLKPSERQVSYLDV